MSEHAQGLMPSYTFTRRPVKLVFSEHYERITDAIPPPTNTPNPTCNTPRSPQPPPPKRQLQTPSTHPHPTATPPPPAPVTPPIHSSKQTHDQTPRRGGLRAGRGRRRKPQTPHPSPSSPIQPQNVNPLAKRPQSPILPSSLHSRRLLSAGGACDERLEEGRVNWASQPRRILDCPSRLLLRKSPPPPLPPKLSQPSTIINSPSHQIPPQDEAFASRRVGYNRLQPHRRSLQPKPSSMA